jgi:hypothetical protein
MGWVTRLQDRIKRTGKTNIKNFGTRDTRTSS